ncbi:MAG: CehA/McbA family metallohydrolase [Ferruginibacter sp.]
MRNNRLYARSVFLLLLNLICNLWVNAQVSITAANTAFTQNFNTLKATAGTSATLPTGWKLLETGTNANTTYSSDAGTTTTGNTYSYGTGTTTERALGTLLSGTLLSKLGVQLKNSTGQTITSITISYTGEEWRCGTAGRADQLDFQYSQSATSLSTGTWIDANSLDFFSPATTTIGAKDGNAVANKTLKTATITGLSIAANGLFWLRWVDFDASGSDDGLAIDDFSITLNGGDLTAPLVASLNPTNNSTAVALNGNLVLNFNENIQKGTAGNILIKKLSDGSIVNTTLVTATSVTVSGAVATIPFSALTNSTGYYVEIPAGTFKDITGNNFAGFAGSATWSFTTLAVASPSIAVNPATIDFGFVAVGTNSAGSSIIFTALNITTNVVLTVASGFELSKDGVTYGSTLNYTQAEALAGQTFFARCSPTAINTNYSALINFSSTGLNINKVQLLGNSNVTVTPGPLNYYFGNMHSHSSYSDGNADDLTKIPVDDYAFAKNALCFDFLGLSEHNHVAAGMHLADWQPGRNAASSASTTSFVGMYGMEWGVISGGGHVIVYGMDSLIGWDPGQYQLYVPKSLYAGKGGLFDVINKHGGNALAYLAHPNNTDYNNLLNGTYDIASDNAIVGTAVESGPAFSTNTSYSNPATSMSYLSYYKNMLSKGYHLGPTIDHDNHNMTFGRTTKSRLVVLAASLSENNLLDGMKRMRFYASQDCAAKINYSINNQPIGSIVTQAGAPVISVSSNTSSAVISVLVMAGVPGSGTVATQMTSSSNGTFVFTDNTLNNLSQRYYYLDIKEADGSRIITSPIWYTRNDLSIRNATLTSFFTVNEEDRVILKWTTENETNGQFFDIERSVDEGRTYSSIGSVAGKGVSNAVLTYGLTDLKPIDGVAYYRLIQKNKNSGINFTDIKVVNRKNIPAAYFTIYPNPVHGLLNVKLTATSIENTAIEIYDMVGRMMLTNKLVLSPGDQNIQIDMSNLQNGTYTLKLKMGNKTTSQLVNKF